MNLSGASGRSPEGSGAGRSEPPISERLVAPRLVVCTLVSAGLYMLSLTQTALHPYSLKESPSGAFMLVFGWWYQLDCFYAWYANVALFSAWTQWYREARYRALVCALVAVGLGVSVLLDSEVVGYGPGYMLWLASMFVTLAGAVSTFVVEPTGKAKPRRIRDRRDALRRASGQCPPPANLEV